MAIEIKGSAKGGLTVLATIGADGSKLPLFIIAKGKTVRVENSQIAPEVGEWTTHTETGWQNKDSFQCYLRHLRSLFPIEEEVHLLLDLHASHRAKNVKDLAQQLNVHLYYIPSVATGELQPPDRRIFCVMKSVARQQFRLRPIERRTTKEACIDLRYAWDHVGIDALNSAWDCY